MIGNSGAAANPGSPQLRLAEPIAALSLAIDLGMGQPMEQALRTCLLSMRLGERIGLRPSELSEVYYVALLRFLGCTADAHETAAIVGGDELAFRHSIAPVLGGSPFEIMGRAVSQLGRGSGPIQRTRAVSKFLVHGQKIPRGARAHCEVAENLATRLGLGDGIRRGLSHALERWDGGGQPLGLSREEISLSARIVFLARDVEVLHRLFSPDDVRRTVRHRRGAAYDPDLVSAFDRHGATLLDELRSATVLASVLDEEPTPRLSIPESDLDRVLEVFADFVDLKSPFLLGHSREVARLAAGAASLLRISERDVILIRRAGLVHDLGRVGVRSGIWDKPGPLTDGEWEQVRLHPYYTERILARSSRLASLAFAGMHHERLNGSGYHRGALAAQQTMGVRILAAADAYHAMTEPRPYRPALGPDEAGAQLNREANLGSLDADAVKAVLSAAGHRPPPARRQWPAGLTDREVEVLRLVCRGASKRQIGLALSISPSTADHHVRHIYDKIGVSTRAGAAVFALSHDLLSSLEK